MEKLTHWKKLTNPNYIGAYSLQPKEERIVMVEKVVREMVNGADGKKEECTVAYLKNEKPLILNKTNCKIMAAIYNTPYVEEWTGKHIILYATLVQAFGETVEALRIKKVLPSNPDSVDLIQKKINDCKSLEEMNAYFLGLPVKNEVVINFCKKKKETEKW